MFKLIAVLISTAIVCNANSNVEKRPATPVTKSNFKSVVSSNKRSALHMSEAMKMKEKVLAETFMTESRVDEKDAAKRRLDITFCSQFSCSNL